MAANYWASSQLKTWVLTKEKLREGHEDDRQCGLNDDEITRIKRLFATLIQAVGNGLKLRQKVTATAMVYFKRFYSKISFVNAEFDPVKMAMSCIYVATKVEECLQQPKNIIAQFNKYKYTFPRGGETPGPEAMEHINQLFRGIPNDRTHETAQKIIEYECTLLQEMKFYLIVYHPYRPLIQYLNDLSGGQSRPSNPHERAAPQSEFEGLKKTAWMMVNDTYRTDLHLLYAPHLIALACLYMAAARDGKDVAPWFAELNIEMKDIAAVCIELLELYEQVEHTRLTDINDAVRILREKRVQMTASHAVEGSIQGLEPQPTPMET